MIGKSLFLLVYIAWVFAAAEAIFYYKEIKAFSSFLILYLLSWKVFGSGKTFWLILFGVLINVTWYIIRYHNPWIAILISFCVTCLVGRKVFELVFKPLGSEWHSAYGVIGLLVIIIAILFTLMLLIGIHRRFKNKAKVEKVLRNWGGY